MPDDAWERYTAWQQTLVAKNRRTDRANPADRARAQQRLLGSAEQSAQALASALRAATGCAATAPLRFPPLEVALTSDEMWHSQPAWEQMLHASLARAPATTRRDASMVLFWVGCSIAWLECGLLPDPPVHALVRRPYDLELLDADAASLDAESLLALDSATRDVLRRVGGIPHVRSSYIHHLGDCPTARAWWRTEIAAQAAAASGGRLSVAACHETLNEAGCWAALIETAMTMAGTLCAGACAAGFVAAARAHRADAGAWPSKTAAMGLLANMSRRSAFAYAGRLDPRALADMAR